MATVQKNISKRTGEVLNWKWTALLERDEEGKQIKLTKRVDPFDYLEEGMTPKQEKKKMKQFADAWEEQERKEYLKSKDRGNEKSAQERREKNKITLVDFIDNVWMEKHIKNGVKKHTPDTISFYTHMSNDIKAYFNTVSPNLKLSQIEKEDIIDYLAYMQNDTKTKRGKAYSKTTKYHHFSTLRSILSYAVTIDYLKDNPCKTIQDDYKPGRTHKKIQFLDTDESVRFINCLDDEKEIEYWEKKDKNHSPLFWKCLVNVLILTGLRRGELVGLQWGDIDRKNMMISVQRNVTIDTSNKDEKDYEKKIHIGQLKARDEDEDRRVPITKYLLDLLDDYKKEQEKNGELLPHAYIFCRNRDYPNQPLYPTEPTRMMAKYIKRHNLPDMSPHDLRHTAGFLAIESGANLKQIQALLGHKDPAVTMKFYVGITDGGKHETVKGIENMIRPQIKTEEKKA